MAEILTSGEAQLLNLKLEHLQDSMQDVKGILGKIEDALSTLVRVEERQIKHASEIARAFVEIDVERKRITKVDETVGTIETSMPSLREMRIWIIGGFGVVIAAIITAILNGSIVVQLAR